LIPDEEIWAEFVTRQGLDQQTLPEYYLGKEDAVTLGERQRIIWELFQDFVQVGALQLPPGNRIEDYDLSLREEVAIDGRRVEALYVRDARNGSEKTLIPNGDIGGLMSKEAEIRSAPASLLLAAFTLLFA
jgi:hypothetical protein